VDVGGRAAIRRRLVVRSSVDRPFYSSSKSKRFQTFQRYFLISLKLVGQRVDLLVDFSVNLWVDFVCSARLICIDWPLTTSALPFNGQNCLKLSEDDQWGASNQ
jgi:hypothetical protein